MPVLVGLFFSLLGLFFSLTGLVVGLFGTDHLSGAARAAGVRQGDLISRNNNAVHINDRSNDNNNSNDDIYYLLIGVRPGDLVHEIRAALQVVITVEMMMMIIKKNRGPARRLRARNTRCTTNASLGKRAWCAPVCMCVCVCVCVCVFACIFIHVYASV
jgi:hypothetical protein